MSAKSQLHEIFQAQGWKMPEYLTEPVIEEEKRTKEKRREGEEQPTKKRILGFVSRVTLNRCVLPSLGSEKILEGKMQNSKKMAEQSVASQVLDFLRSEILTQEGDETLEAQRKAVQDFINKTCGRDSLLQDIPLLCEFLLAKEYRNCEVPLGLLLTRANKTQLRSMFGEDGILSSKARVDKLFQLFGNETNEGSKIRVYDGGACILCDEPLVEEMLEKSKLSMEGPVPHEVTVLRLSAKSHAVETVKIITECDPYMPLAKLFGLSSANDLYFYGKVGKRKITEDWVRPHMFARWGGDANGSRNSIASQVAGLEIYDTVILARVGAGWEKGGSICCSDFHVSDLYAMIDSTTISGIYRSSMANSLLVHLPSKYSRSSGWFGKPPISILQEYSQFHRSCTFKVEFEQLDSDRKGNESSSGHSNATDHLLSKKRGPVSCTIVLAHPQLQRRRFISKPYTSKSASENSAALSALQCLALLEAEAVGKDFTICDWKELERANSLPDCDYSARTPWESILTISYRISLAGKTLEESEDFVLEHGSGGILSPVEETLQEMRPSDRRKISINMQIRDGSIQCFQIEFMLKGVTPPTGPGPAVLRLFTPPLAVQRYEFAKKQISAAGLRNVVDLGCGEGRLIVELLEMSLDRVIGIDALRSNMEIATANLKTKMKDLIASDSSYSTEITFLHGSLTNCASLKCLQGIDVVTMLEVVEHMDEKHLAEVGPAVFDGLQPSMIIITTPNYEYNRILQRKLSELAGVVDGPDTTTNAPYRDADHRFEWKRTEFQNWCKALSKKHGYSVEFTGIGRLSGDDSGPEGFVGHASQGVVFKKLDSNPQMKRRHRLEMEISNEWYDIVWNSGSIGQKQRRDASCTIS